MTKVTITPHHPIEKYFDSLTKYHYYFFFFLFISKVPIFWHVLSLIFLSPPMDFYCNITAPAGVTNLKNYCPCKEPWWDRSVFSETMQSKYGLVCSDSWMISFSQSMIYVGLLIGAFSFGFMSDRYGRLTMFTVCIFTIASAGCLVRFMPSAGTFIMLRCVEGAGVGGAIVTSYVLCVEYCGVKQRETVPALFHVPINLGHVSLPGVSYLLRHCDDLQLALSVPVFIFVGLYWILRESPKWLMDVGNIDKSIKIVEKIFKFNGKPTDGVKEEMQAFFASQQADKKNKLSFWQLFKYKALVINFCCMSFIYFVCGMGYYGVSQYIGKMSGNIHANVAISGTVLIPGTFTAVFLLTILPRRTLLMSTKFLSGIFMFIVVFIPDSLAGLRVGIACICNCFFFMSFITVFLYGVELFPTSIRNSVLGVLSVVSRVGQIAAPPLNSLPQKISGTIFAIMALLAAVICYPLPETKNTELPSTLDDTKDMSRRRSSQPEQSGQDKGKSGQAAGKSSQAAGKSSQDQ